MCFPRVAKTQGWDAFGRTEYSNLPENQAGNIGAAQSQYFLDIIAENDDVRWTFLFMHKAPWLREDMKTFTAIEAALAERPYTVFITFVWQRPAASNYPTTDALWITSPWSR